MGNKTNLIVRLAMSIFLAAMSYATASGKTIYVDSNAPAGGNGQSWGTAYKYLQDALNDPCIVDGDEIWVAEGTYTPDANSLIPDGSGDRGATFQLISGVALYGGFPLGGSAWEIRDPNRYETILSGDLNGNDNEVDSPYDLPSDPNRDENSGHVVSINWADGITTLDGFTIEGGRAGGGKGGGIIVYDVGGTLNLRNCIVTRNSGHHGGGICLWNIETETIGGNIINCKFYWNYGDNGGAIYLRGYSPVIQNCSFLENARNGGALYCMSFQGWPTAEVYSNPIVVNSTFIRNDGVQGGAIYNNGEGTPTMINCLFLANHASAGGGASYSNGMFVTAHETFINCTIVYNFADRSDYGGGGISANAAHPVVYNSILWGNWDPSGVTQIKIDWMDTATVQSSCIQGGYIGEGNISLDPLFVDMGCRCDRILRYDGDSRLRWNSPCVNTGDPNYLPTIDEKDLDGNTRIAGGQIDMGCYELMHSPDISTDYIVNFDDFAIFAQNWMNIIGDSDEATFDFDNNGIIDTNDLSEITEEWLNTGFYFVQGLNTPNSILLTVSSTPGGSVENPGEGRMLYDCNTTLSLKAVAYNGSIFENWTGSAVDAGKVTDPNISETSVLLDNDYTLQANFDWVIKVQLTASSTLGGFVDVPGEGQVLYNVCTLIPLKAKAYNGCIFENWTGSAVDAGKVAGPNISETSVWMDNDYTLQANFDCGEVNVIDIGLIAYWSFDEGAGTVANDYSGNNNNGTINGGATWISGVSEQALDFNGTSDYVSGTPFTTASRGSILAWIKPITATDNTIFQAVSTENKEDYLWFRFMEYNGSQALGFYTKSHGSVDRTRNLVYTNSSDDLKLTDGYWHHVVMTHDGSSYRFYVDDVELTNLIYTYGSGYLWWFDNLDFANLDEWNIGRNNQGGESNSYFDGSIDEVYIYDRALSQEEIQYLYILPFPEPGRARNPIPPNGSIISNLDFDLSWTAGSYAISHDVYFGTSNPPPFVCNQTATTFEPGRLTSGTTYYWRIDEVNEVGKTNGEVWSFMAIEPWASNPNPADGATSVSVYTDLSWTAGLDATSHDVYFGRSNPPPFVCNQISTTYDPGTMAYNNTTYYWRIDEVSPYGKTTGFVWRFTTSRLSPPPP